MKKLALLLVAGFLLAVSQLTANAADSHLAKMDWQKQLAEAQKENDYGKCHEVTTAAYLDNNKEVLDKAAEICWPIGKNDPRFGQAWAIMGVETKEDYIVFTGKSLGGK